jgi:hypothetical protein
MAGVKRCNIGPRSCLTSQSRWTTWRSFDGGWNEWTSRRERMSRCRIRRTRAQCYKTFFHVIYRFLWQNSGAPLEGRLLALPTNIRLGWKGLPGTLAYFKKICKLQTKKFYNIGPRTQASLIRYLYCITFFSSSLRKMLNMLGPLSNSSLSSLV